MNSNALVNSELDAGSRLITALSDGGMEIVVAFWTKLTEAPGWSLYLASPVAETDAESINPYRKLTTILSEHQELGIDIDDVLIIDADDAMAVQAADILKSKLTNGKPYTGITRFKGFTLGGLEIDGAYIYPPPRAAVSA